MQEQDNIFNTEIGQKLLVLTRAGFAVSNQITDLIMRDKIKEKILDIYGAYGSGRRAGDLLKEIEALDNLLHLSGHLNLAKDEHIKKLRNGYLVLKSHIILSNQKPDIASSPNISRPLTQTPDIIDQKREQIKKSDITTPTRTKISERYGKILNFIQSNGSKAQLSDIMNLFPKLSEKSVRNDLAQLCADGKLKRIGWGPTSHYTSQ